MNTNQRGFGEMKSPCVKYFIYYFDDGFAYFNYTLRELKKTDIIYRYKTNSELYDTFINQSKFRPITFLEERKLDTKDIIPTGKEILRKLNIPRDKIIGSYLFI